MSQIQINQFYHKVTLFHQVPISANNYDIGSYSKYLPQRKDSNDAFIERFKGKISKMDKEGHIGVANNAVTPILKVGIQQPLEDGKEQ